MTSPIPKQMQVIAYNPATAGTSRHYYTDKDWSKHKEEILSMRQQKIPLPKIKDVMRKRFNFNATDAQYKAAFKKWESNRYLSKNDRRFIVQQVARAVNAGGQKISRFLQASSGEVLDSNQVARIWKRNIEDPDAIMQMDLDSTTLEVVSTNDCLSLTPTSDMQINTTGSLFVSPIGAVWSISPRCDQLISEQDIGLFAQKLFKSLGISQEFRYSRENGHGDKTPLSLEKFSTRTSKEGAKLSVDTQSVKDLVHRHNIRCKTEIMEELLELKVGNFDQWEELQSAAGINVFSVLDDYLGDLESNIADICISGDAYGSDYSQPFYFLLKTQAHLQHSWRLGDWDSLRKSFRQRIRDLIEIVYVSMDAGDAFKKCDEIEIRRRFLKLGYLYYDFDCYLCLPLGSEAHKAYSKAFVTDLRRISRSPSTYLKDEITVQALRGAITVSCHQGVRSVDPSTAKQYLILVLRDRVLDLRPDQLESLILQWAHPNSNDYERLVAYDEAMRLALLHAGYDTTLPNGDDDLPERINLRKTGTLIEMGRCLDADTILSSLLSSEPRRCGRINIRYLVRGLELADSYASEVATSSAASDNNIISSSIATGRAFKYYQWALDYLPTYPTKADWWFIKALTGFRNLLSIRGLVLYSVPLSDYIVKWHEKKWGMLDPGYIRAILEAAEEATMARIQSGALEGLG